MGKSTHTRSMASKRRRNAARKRNKKMKFQEFKLRTQNADDITSPANVVLEKEDTAPDDVCLHSGNEGMTTSHAIENMATCHSNIMDSEKTHCNNPNNTQSDSENDSDSGSDSLFDVSTPESSDSECNTADERSGRLISRTRYSSKFAQSTKSCAGYDAALKESYSKDPLEVGYILWYRNAQSRAQSKIYFNKFGYGT